MIFVIPGRLRKYLNFNSGCLGPNLGIYATVPELRNRINH
jgi:hypothetical protein